MSFQDKQIISTNEYFEILGKQEEELSPSDIVKKENYENFIRDCHRYESLISDTAQTILSEYNTKTSSVAVKENKTVHEEEFLQDLQSTFNQNVEPEETQEYTRKLTKAGYIDATVILVILLNIGIIVAFSIIGR